MAIKKSYTFTGSQWKLKSEEKTLGCALALVLNSQDVYPAQLTQVIGIYVWTGRLAQSKYKDSWYALDISIHLKPIPKCCLWWEALKFFPTEKVHFYYGCLCPEDVLNKGMLSAVKGWFVKHHPLVKFSLVFNSELP